MGKPLAYIPSPSISSFHIGPLVVHFYALMYLVGIALAILITRRRWAAAGGDPDLVGEVALWSVPAGIVGGRIYFDITTPADIPHVWYGVFAVWDGGLGIWGGIFVAAVVGLWRIRRAGANGALFMDAVAPALLVAQGIGRVGNYFNKELFGGPTTLPWGLQIPYQYRIAGGIPAKDLGSSTFQPTFLYELIWDVALAAILVWLGHHRKIKAPGLFALYVAGYSAFRIFEESLRVDSSEHFLGLRLNMYVASALVVIGLVWFWRSQRRPEPAAPPQSPQPEEEHQKAEHGSSLLGLVAGAPAAGRTAAPRHRGGRPVIRGDAARHRRTCRARGEGRRLRRQGRGRSGPRGGPCRDRCADGRSGWWRGIRGKRDRRAVHAA